MREHKTSDVLPFSPASPQRLKYSAVSSSIIGMCWRNRAMFSPVLNIFFCSRKIWAEQPEEHGFPGLCSDNKKQMNTEDYNSEYEFKHI